MGLVGLLVASCSQDPAEAPQQATEQAARQQATRQQAEVVVDAEVAPFQRDLLEFAFEAASKFPKFPHKKNRGRAQEQVLEACFELELPKLALSMAPQAEGWRRGLVYADFAYFSAKQGVTAYAPEYLEMAEAVIAEELADPAHQAWRVDKVRQKISRALAELGRLDEAVEVAGKIDPSSRGSVDVHWAATISTKVQDMDAAQAREDLQRITESWESQTLGEQYASLLVLSALHGRFFEDEALRAALEERVLLRYFKLPASVRLDAMAPMVGHYLANEDVEGAKDVIVQMGDLIEKTRWRTEDQLPELSRLAELRIDAGDRVRARADLEAALRSYQEQRDSMFDIYRCEALRPVALGFHALGDAEQFAGLLALAVEEGAENPNARPRCDDLVETCVTLARRGIEPPPAVMARLREISAGLVEPW